MSVGTSSIGSRLPQHGVGVVVVEVEFGVGVTVKLDSTASIIFFRHYLHSIFTLTQEGVQGDTTIGLRR